MVKTSNLFCEITLNRTSAQKINLIIYEEFSSLFSKETLMKKYLIGSTLLASFIVIGCASTPGSNNLQDGADVALPKNYESWPVFIKDIEKSNGEIRDIYVNQVGTKAKKGEAFANGSSFVMAIYKTKDDGYGGKQKGDLAKVFVMTKGKGNGSQAKINNGDWAYGAYNAQGELIKDTNYDGCRGCHAPLADKDYIFHYDQYFDQKVSLNLPHDHSVLAAYSAATGK